jgi:outer membrane scaffolding protein for murein synthesis (MipA/OmpV family)
MSPTQHGRTRLAAVPAAFALAAVLAAAPAARAQEQPMPGPVLDAKPAEQVRVDPATTTSRTEPLWELGLGVSAVRFPDYRGSDETSTYVLPLPFVAYRGRFLRADRDGARAILFAGRRIEVDVSLSASTPSRSKDNAARRGMPDLEGTFEIGPNLNVELWQSGDRRYKLDLRLPVRQAVTISGDPQGVGITFSPNLNLDIRNLAGSWNVGLLGGPLYANRRHHAYYYDVAPQFATPGRPAYRAGGGYAGWRALAATSRRIGNAWVGGFVRYDDLGEATFVRSPLVTTRHSLTAGIGISWIFATSSERVSTPD